MKENWKAIWQRFVLAALEAISALSRILPLRVMLGLGDSLGGVAYSVSKRYRKMAMKNLNLAFGPLLTESEKQAITRRVFVNFAKSAIEFPIASRLSSNHIQRLVLLKDQDKAVLDQMVNSGHSFISISAHFGNFELMARRLAVEGYKFVVVVRNDNNAEVADAINKIRMGSGYDVIGRGEAASVLLRRMKRETDLCVVMLPDQKSDEVFVPFFGQVTGTVAGPAVIALRTQSPILPIFCVRQADDTHEIVIGEPILPKGQDGSRKTAEGLMCEINDAIECMVRKHPDQWLWLHDRWKVKPPPGLKLKTERSAAN